MTVRTLIVLAAMGLAGTALAASLPPFEKVDADGNGTLSRTEAAAVAGLDFSAADKNNDGMLDRGEYEAAGKTG